MALGRGDAGDNLVTILSLIGTMVGLAVVYVLPAPVARPSA